MERIGMPFGPWSSGRSSSQRWCKTGETSSDLAIDYTAVHRVRVAPSEFPMARVVPENAAVDLVQRGTSGQSHRDLELGSQDREQVDDPYGPGNCEGVQDRLTNHHGVRAQREGLEDVSAAPD